MVRQGLVSRFTCISGRFYQLLGLYVIVFRVDFGANKKCGPQNILSKHTEYDIFFTCQSSTII